jgi:hypothetical protein
MIAGRKKQIQVNPLTNHIALPLDRHFLSLSSFFEKN